MPDYISVIIKNMAKIKVLLYISLIFILIRCYYIWLIFIKIICNET